MNECACAPSRVLLFVTPWTVARQALLSMGFSRQEYWSGLSFPSPGDLPHPEIKSTSPALAATVLYHRTTREAQIYRETGIDINTIYIHIYVYPQDLSLDISLFKKLVYVVKQNA